jgi:hypothetical protein
MGLHGLLQGQLYLHYLYHLRMLYFYVEFEVLTAVVMNSSIFWDITAV